MRWWEWGASINHVSLNGNTESTETEKEMTEDQKTQMYAYMSAHDDDDMPDGAWQAMLEDAAKEWARKNGEEVDGHDAFMEYLRAVQ